MSHKENNLISDDIKLKMFDFIHGNMSNVERKAFNQLILDNSQYVEELAALQSAQDLMQQHDQASIPEPSGQMDINFYTMLDAETERSSSQNKVSLWQKLQSWIQLPKLRKAAYGLSFMFFGVLIGHYVHLLDDQSNIEAERLAIKDQQIQALAVLSLLDMPSANKRLIAVNLAGEMTSSQAGSTSQPNQTVVDALLTTLNQDDNINVRLEALEVLSQYSATDSVRNGLVNAINHQDSPMVQLAIAQLMLQLKEQQAIKPIQRLLEKPETLEPVRATLNETLEELI